MPTIRLFLKGPLSQWVRSDFIINGNKYNCCEQWMMAEKARLFKDDDVHQKIMAAGPDNPAFNARIWIDYPREQKKLGREVKGFIKEEWEKVAQAVVYRGNHAKFSQNPELWAILDATGDDILAEANPRDPIWGIGLAADDPRALDKTTWQGKNWLGEALMKAREQIRKDKKT